MAEVSKKERVPITWHLSQMTNADVEVVFGTGTEGQQRLQRLKDFFANKANTVGTSKVTYRNETARKAAIKRGDKI